MCCGPDNLQWFALSVFRIADMIGIDGHVSFLPKKKKKKKIGLIICSCIRTMNLPFRRAIARLVPSVCGTWPPREGGPHVRLIHHIVLHAMAKQLPLSWDVLWTRHSPVVCFICLSGC